MRRTSYIDKINAINKWAKREFPPKQTHLAMFLILDRFNEERWPDGLSITLYEFMGIVRASSKKQAIEIRDELIEYGFLVYRPGKKGAPSVYCLGDNLRYSQDTLFPKKGVKKGCEKDTLFCDSDGPTNYSNNHIIDNNSITTNRKPIGSIKKTEECAEPKNRSTQEAVILLPLNTGDDYPIFQESVEEWTRLYQSVDISQELNKIRGWLLANPTRRKTRSGIMRFVNGWLSREQDRGRRNYEGEHRQKKSSNPFLDYLEREKGDEIVYEQASDGAGSVYSERSVPCVLPGADDGGRGTDDCPLD